MGRRIWRRRTRKRSAPGAADAATDATSSAAAGQLEGGDEDDDAALPLEPPLFDIPDTDVINARRASGTQAKPGLFRALRDRIFGNADAPARSRSEEPAYLATDPVGEVLSVPRGAARLEAFEAALRDATPGQPVHRDLSLAFFRELTALTEHAGIELSLLDTRVEACAQALLAAGEEERAGALFLRMGARHRAVDALVKVGAVEALEEVYAQIQWDEGGAKQEARLAFERFEALFVVGMREAALRSLERALSLWGDNPVFNEVHASFVARLGRPHRHLLRAGRHEVAVVSRWPLVIGRGEDAALRLTSPLLSRAHVELVHTGDVVAVRDLDSKGGTRVDGRVLDGALPLDTAGTIDMGGVVVRYARRADAVVLTPAVAPERSTCALLGATLTLPMPDGTPSVWTLRIDALGRAHLQPGGLLNGEALKRETLVLEGDRVGPWTVTRA